MTQTSLSHSAKHPLLGESEKKRERERGTHTEREGGGGGQLLFTTVHYIYPPYLLLLADWGHKAALCGVRGKLIVPRSRFFAASKDLRIHTRTYIVPVFPLLTHVCITPPPYKFAWSHRMQESGQTQCGQEDANKQIPQGNSCTFPSSPCWCAHSE